jgi:hypothetical protein
VVGAGHEDRHGVQIPEHGRRLPGSPSPGGFVAVGRDRTRRSGSFEAAHDRRLIVAGEDWLCSIAGHTP